MFEVTEAAGSRLAQKLNNKDAGENVVMRFTRKERGWKLRLDKGGPGDVLLAHKGRTVLVMDSKVAEGLSDRTLDAQTTPAGSRLFLR